MSRNAAAIVVGIDRYDDPDIPALNGSVYDAKASVDWLIKIGVPVERIRLHMSPQPADGALPMGVKAKPATFDSIVGSFDALSKDKGDQLFVMLSGHGIAVSGAGGGPVFLAQDYGSGAAASLKNLRMLGFIEWMVHWGFGDQFLFYDACQNPRTSVGRVSFVRAVDPPGLDALPVAATGSLLACFSAALGQRAWAGTGQGVLMRNLFAQLEPETFSGIEADAQIQDAIIYDWTTGARAIDMRALFEDIVAPQITQEAADAQNAQTPVCQPYGRGGTKKEFPILALPDEPTANLTVTVVPDQAVDSLKLLRLSIQLPARKLVLPLPGMRMPNPFLCKAPDAVEVMATCSAKPGEPWRPIDSPQKAKILGAAATITLTLTDQPTAPPGDPTGMFNIRVTSPDGQLHHPLGGAYEDIAKENDLTFDLPDDLSFEHHEHGPDIGFDAGIVGSEDAAGAVAHDWLRAIRSRLKYTDLSVLLIPPGVDPNDKAPNLRFVGEGWLADFAGFLEEEPVVAVTAAGEDMPALRLTANAIANHPEEWIEPGPYRVTIDLPWGRWSQLIQASDTGEPTTCPLPEKVGREPLRNAWRRAGSDVDPTGQLGRSLSQRIPEALAADLILLVDEQGDDDRVEPFSHTALPEWDLLFSAGRLDGVCADRIDALVASPLTDMTTNERDLLMIGLGHAALNLSAWDTLGRVLRSVSGSFRLMLDVAVLHQRLGVARGDVKAAAIQAKNICKAALDRSGSRAPPFLVGWSGSMLASLLQDQGMPVPDSLLRLSPNSVVAVRTRADAANEIETSPPRQARPSPPAEDTREDDWAERRRGHRRGRSGMGIYDLRTALREARADEDEAAAPPARASDEGEAEA